MLLKTVCSLCWSCIDQEYYSFQGFCAKKSPLSEGLCSLKLTLKEEVKQLAVYTGLLDKENMLNTCKFNQHTEELNMKAKYD